jgi:arylsulfatase A-like enzyme
LITDRAVDFVTRRRNEPFFLYLAYLAPHYPIDAPADEVRLHLGKLAEAATDKPVKARYAAMVTRLDRNVGRLVGTLEQLGLDQKTLLVFTSDNGATFEWGNQGASATLDSNGPFRGQKRTLWEGGIRVPGLICWPERIKAGQVSTKNIHLTDIFPTFVAAAGGVVNPNWRIDGIDLMPILSGQSTSPPEPFSGSGGVKNATRCLRCISTGNWSLPPVAGRNSTTSPVTPPNDET